RPFHRPAIAEGRDRPRAERKTRAQERAGTRLRRRRPVTIALPAAAHEPHPDCAICPRLHDFIAVWRAREPGWFNAPVPTFEAAGGDGSVEFLIVGLAPGLRGANRTGRPFTGDYAGDLLYSTLRRFG